MAIFRDFEWPPIEANRRPMGRTIYRANAQSGELTVIGVLVALISSPVATWVCWSVLGETIRRLPTFRYAGDSRHTLDRHHRRRSNGRTG